MSKNWIAFIPFDGEAPYVNIGDNPHFALLEEGMPELRTEVNLMASGYLPHSSQGLFAKGEITPGGYVKFEDASGDRNAIADVVYDYLSRTASFIVEADATILSIEQAFEKIIANASTKRFKAKFFEMVNQDLKQNSLKWLISDDLSAEKTYLEFIDNLTTCLDKFTIFPLQIPWLLNDSDVGPQGIIQSTGQTRERLKNGFYKIYDPMDPNSDGGYRAIMKFFDLLFKQMMEDKNYFSDIINLMYRAATSAQDLRKMKEAIVAWDVFSKRKVTDSYDFVKLDSELVQNLKTNPYTFLNGDSKHYFETEQIPYDNRDVLGPAIRFANEAKTPAAVLAVASKIIMKNMRSTNTAFVARNFGLGGRLIEGVPSVDPDKNRPDAWEFYELETQDDYANEGAVLDHCIGGGHGYYERAHDQGISRDFSVRLKGVPQATFTIMNDPGSYVLSAMHSWKNGIPTYPTAFALRDIFAYLGVDTSEEAIGERKSKFYEDFLSGDHDQYENSKERVRENGETNLLEPMSWEDYWETLRDLNAKGKYAYGRFIMPLLRDDQEGGDKELEEYMNTYSPEEVLQGIRWSKENNTEHVDPDFGPMRENRKLIQASSISEKNTSNIFINLIDIYLNKDALRGGGMGRQIRRANEMQRRVVEYASLSSEAFEGSRRRAEQAKGFKAALGISGKKMFDSELRTDIVVNVAEFFEEETLLTRIEDEIYEEALENASRWAEYPDDYRSMVAEIIGLVGLDIGSKNRYHDVIILLITFFFREGKNYYRIEQGEEIGNIKTLSAKAKEGVRYWSKDLQMKGVGDAFRDGDSFCSEVFGNNRAAEEPFNEIIDLISERLARGREDTKKDTMGDDFYDQVGAKNAAYYYVIMSYLNTSVDPAIDLGSKPNVGVGLRSIVANSTRPNETIQKMVEFLLDESVSSNDLLDAIASQSYATENAIDDTRQCLRDLDISFTQWRRSFAEDPGVGAYLFYQNFYSNYETFKNIFSAQQFNLIQQDINGNNAEVELEDGGVLDRADPRAVDNAKQKYFNRIYQKVKEDHSIYIEDKQLPLFQEIERPDWWVVNDNGNGEKTPVFINNEVYNYPSLSPSTTLQQIQRAAEITFIKIIYDIAEIVAETSSDPGWLRNVIEREDWKRLYNTLGMELYHLDNENPEVLSDYFKCTTDGLLGEENEYRKFQMILEFARGKIDDNLLDMWSKTFDAKTPFVYFNDVDTLAQIANPTNLVPAKYNGFTNDLIVAVNSDILAYAGSFAATDKGTDQRRMKNLLKSFGIISEYFEEGYRQGLEILWHNASLRKNFPAVGYVEEYAAWVQIAMRNNASDMLALGMDDGARDGTHAVSQMDLAESLSTLSRMKLEPPDATESEITDPTIGGKNLAIMRFNNGYFRIMDLTQADAETGSNDEVALKMCDTCSGYGLSEYSDFSKICEICNGHGLVTDNTCSNCKGNGEVNIKCPKCDGTEKLKCDGCDMAVTDRRRPGMYIGSGKAQCGYCDGDGHVDGLPCESCEATGRVTCGLCNGHGQTTCYDCDSDGRVTAKCDVCDGEGVV